MRPLLLLSLILTVPPVFSQDSIGPSPVLTQEEGIATPAPNLQKPTEKNLDQKKSEEPQSTEQKEEKSEISDSSLKVLEIASKTVDTASGFVSLSGYILAGIALLMTLAALVLQIIGSSAREKAIKKAIEDTIAGLASNDDFSEQLIQALIQREKFKTYIFDQIDSAVRSKAIEVVNKDFVEAQKSRLEATLNQAFATQNTSTNGVSHSE